MMYITLSLLGGYISSSSTTPIESFPVTTVDDIV
jgi:hypothetical protein